MEGPQLHQIFLSPTTCVELADRDRKDFPDAVETLYHEWFHSNFMMWDEGDVECHALFIYRYVLRHYWGVTAELAERYYRAAFKAHVKLGLAWPAYMGTCVYPQEDPTP